MKNNRRHPNHSTALILFFTLFSFLSSAQNSTVDSLEKKLTGKLTDAQRAWVLLELVNEKIGIDFDQAYTYCQEAIRYAERTDSSALQCHSYYSMGRLCVVGAFHLDTGAIYAQKSIDKAYAIQDTQRILYGHLLSGAILDYMDQTQDAIGHYFDAIPIARHLRDSESLASVYNNMGVLYQYSKDPQNALKYYKEALAFMRSSKDTLAIARCLANMSSVTEDPEQGLEYNFEAIRLLELIPHQPQVKALSSGKIAHIYLDIKEQPKEALPWFQKAFNYAHQAGIASAAASNEYGIGNCYMQLGQLDSAEHYLNRCYAFYKSESQADNIHRIARDLAAVHAEKGDFPRAYELLLESFTIRDSIYTRDLADAISEKNAKYEKEENEADLARQKLETAKEKNRKNQILIGSLLLLLLLSFVFQWFYNRQRQRKKETELALEKEQLERNKLEELDQLKTRFFANISHELRTPLTLIMAPLEKLIQEEHFTPKQEKEIQLALSNTGKLHNLVNEILDLSKLESGKLSLELEPTQLFPLIERIFFSFQSLADIRQIKLQLDYTCPQELSIQMDRDKLEKILNNLISNAIKFTPNEGRVNLGVQLRDENLLEICVTDTGQGIAPEDLPRIFDRFYQVGTEGGTGIGLALARELSKLFGGNIHANSTVGKGSEFKLTMPIQVEHGQGAWEPPVVKSEKINPAVYTPILDLDSKPRILIVEDHPEMQAFLRDSLQEFYDCTVASDGAEALKKLQTEHFDLTSSDVMMPGMDGFSLREKINQIPRLRHMPFILLTARALDDDRLHGLRLGVDDYITKPFSLPELKARIQNLLQNKFEREQFWSEQADLSVVISPETESADRELIKEAERNVLQNLDQSTYKISDLATEIGYSERQLRRIIKNMTGLSPVEFILEIRLQKARQLLEKRSFFTVAEVQFEVGIESASYFSRKFTERFGKNPSDYLPSTSK